MGNLLLVTLLVVVALVIVAALKGRLSRAGGDELAFEARNELFSPAERSFYGVLEQAVAGEFKVFGKVRLGDVIQPAKGLSKSLRTSLRNRVQQKHVDYVLCRSDTLEVAGVVELDDATHNRQDRVDRDGFVDKALVSAGIPVLHFSARKAYSLTEVRAKLVERFSTEARRAEVEKPAASATVKEPARLVDQPKATPPAQKMGVAGPEPSSSPSCPACSSVMVKRQAQNGPNAGKWFWACSAFPKCRKILAVGDE